jgi:predicted permease
MRNLMHDVRNAWRQIAAQPVLSSLTVLVLGAGLATVLYVLAIINGLMLRSLPFPEAGELYFSGLYVGDNRDDDIDSVPQRDADDIARRLNGLAEVATWSGGTVNLVDGERAERHDGVFASPNLFATLGVAPAIGDGLHASDALPNAPVKVLIDWDSWQRDYFAEPDVIGRAVRVNGESATIVGVMPRYFSFPRRTTLWLAARASVTPQRADDRPMQLVLRVQSEAALPAVRTQLEAWLEEAAREEPSAFRDARPALLPIAEFWRDPGTRATLGFMLAATILVLLVACGNAANLMLARHLGRRQELAVRVALGASRARIAAAMLAHSLVLSAIAAALALVCAQAAVSWTIEAFSTIEDAGPPRWMRFDLDLGMVAATVVTAILTGIASGLWPALKLSRSVGTALRDGGRGLAGASAGRVGGYLVMVEIALSAALLIGALAMVQMVRALDSFDLGVRTERVLTARVGLFDTQYPDAAARQRLFERLSERLRADPEVEDATVSTALPGIMGPNVNLLPESAPPTEIPVAAGIATADEHFGSTYRTQLLSGRWFDARDRADSAAVAIVDRKFLGPQAAVAEVLGKRYRLAPGTADERVVTVVGVIEALTLEDADDPPEPVVLVPQAQQPPNFATIAVRTRGEPASFKPRLIALMREIDPDTPLYWLRTYREVLEVANFDQNLLTGIYGVFGLIAMLLAAGGLYGVVGFNVQQRTREIGVRRALGASAASVIGSLVRRSARQIGIGLALGLGLGVPFSIALLRSLEQAQTLDPMIWFVVAVLLGTVALMASWIPARRAVRVDPMQALRDS